MRRECGIENQYPTKYDDFSFSDFLEQVYPAADPAQRTAVDAYYIQYCHVRFFDLRQVPMAVDQTVQLPEKIAYTFNALVVAAGAEGWQVGFVNPYDPEAVQAISTILQTEIQPVMLKKKDMCRLLCLTYRKIEEIQQYAERMIIPTHVIATPESLSSQIEDPMTHLAQLILRDAMLIGASDIHVEVNREDLQIRLRVDGALQQYALPHVAIGAYLVRYFKLLAGADIIQDQKPSEGKNVTLLLAQQRVHLRISFMPTYGGQSVVIRFLGDAQSYRLAEKIQHPVYLQEIQDYLSRSYGMFLVSGPTGSGKTTTLYSALQEINVAEKNIITLEDPVEVNIPRVNQVQINELRGYDFSDALRAALRQDPDVIMLGEIRDDITANMAVRAAITGHLVLSTVHARGVAEIPIRLLNLGVNPYLLASALRLTASQRLVKKICSNCKAVATLTAREQSFLEKHAARITMLAASVPGFYQGRGCYLCQGSGSAQRQAIFEVLRLTPEMITCLLTNNIPEYLALVTLYLKGKTIIDHCFAAALRGEIALSEVMRMESD